MPVLRVTDTPDEPPPPRADVLFDKALKRLEKRVRDDREHRFLTEHPEGIGPTLGQDLGGPVPGHGADWTHEGYEPPG